MKIDLYTKIVLSVIAFMLTLIACQRPFVGPDMKAAADGSFSGIQFSWGENEFTFFDTRTGDLWEYKAFRDSKDAPGYFRMISHYKVNKLGDDGQYLNK
jgi:hypothetical protein